MLKFLFSIPVLFLLGCTSSPAPAPSNPVAPIVCSVESAAASAISASIGNALTCANLSAIQGDVLAALGKANLCAQAVPPAASAQKPSLKGVVGSVVCPLAVDAAMGLLTKQVPIAWGCLPSKDPGSINAALSSACIGVVGI